MPFTLQRFISNDRFTVDQYDSLGWVTLFDSPTPNDEIKKKLIQNNINCAVTIQKSKTGLPKKPKVWFGEVPSSVIVKEYGVKYEIRTGSSHPGLFLDHELTRKWLQENSKDKTILNLFSYTGSLAIAAAVGGASKALSIDLSNSTTAWAKENARLNQLSEEHQFIKGDVFDWTQRLKKKKSLFDIVISDPPSQSRSDEFHFSTTKHLDLLHERCIELIAANGILITSINTQTMSVDVLIASVHNEARKLNRKIERHEILKLPKGFSADFRSMKGLRFYFDQ